MFNTTAEAGAGTQTPNSEGHGTAQTPVPKTYTEEEFNKATAALRREEESKASEYKKKAKEYDALAAKLKEKEEAELSESEKLKKRLAELEPLSAQVKEYEETFTTLLNKKLEQVPEDKRGLIPDLSPRKKLEWLESAFAAGLFVVQAGIGSPPSGVPPQGKPDALMATAEEKVKKFYGESIKQGSEQWKAKVHSVYQQLLVQGRQSLEGV
jgi:hypothetical protein